MSESNKAPEGKLWVCLACGKTAKDRYGDISDWGWDESCMLNSELFDEEQLERDEHGRVVNVKQKEKP